MRYRDAPRMIDWLCDTFGFTKHLAVPNDEGGIAHAQLTFGTGMIMLGSVRQDAEGWGALIKQPGETGGFETQSPYIVVADVDALYERAKAAGAEIVTKIADQDYGSRDFCCRDPEGHLWNFGTYNPWTS
ncbi:MAG: glyoxalase [Rhodomicrobium sp.]|nr:glyoxalase [Rhodomicrobium sp.]